MILLLDTGVRLSELTNIRLLDVSLENNEILITKGKGNKERSVYFQYQMKEHFKKYMNELDHDYLFIERSNKPLKNKSIQDRLTLYGELAQINKRVGPHTFRHTFAKYYITNGGDGFSPQQILGHTSTEMTRKYVQLFGTDLRQMHKKFRPIEGLL